MSETFVQALAAAGVIEDIRSVRRIVIDAQANHPLMVYVERFGERKWLAVAELARGVEVVTDR